MNPVEHLVTIRLHEDDDSGAFVMVRGPRTREEAIAKVRSDSPNLPEGVHLDALPILPPNPSAWDMAGDGTDEVATSH